MLETLLITFREGLEAFLIVAIMLAYLHKTGRHDLCKGVYAGIGTALLISVTAGWHVAELAEDPVWEGSLAMLAGVLVASFTIYIMKTAKNIRADIGERLEESAQKAGPLASAGVFVFTVLMIAREGMETALMLGTISVQTNATEMWIGAIGGLAFVAIIAALWSSQSHKINLRLFLQVTGIFLVLFSIHLFIYGVHELSEMLALPFLSENLQYTLHIYTEPFGHDSLYAQLITYSLLAVPLGWLGFAYIKEKMLNANNMAAE